MAHLATSVFVGRLNFQTAELDLQFHFEQCGKVKSCQIVRTDDGRSKGFGFVCFSRPQDAEFAVKKLDKSLLDGKEIHVEFSKEGLRKRMDAKQEMRQAIQAQRQEQEITAQIEETNTKQASSDHKNEDQHESRLRPKHHRHRHHH